jgi:hypothetical protein
MQAVKVDWRPAQDGDLGDERGEPAADQERHREQARLAALTADLAAKAMPANNLRARQRRTVRGDERLLTSSARRQRLLAAPARPPRRRGAGGQAARTTRAASGRRAFLSTSSERTSPGASASAEEVYLVVSPRQGRRPRSEYLRVDEKARPICAFRPDKSPRGAGQSAAAISRSPPGRQDSLATASCDQPTGRPGRPGESGPTSARSGRRARCGSPAATELIKRSLSPSTRAKPRHGGVAICNRQDLGS